MQQREPQQDGNMAQSCLSPCRPSPSVSVETLGKARAVERPGAWLIIEEKPAPQETFKTIYSVRKLSLQFVLRQDWSPSPHVKPPFGSWMMAVALWNSPASRA